MIEETIGYLDLNGKMFKHKEFAIESSLKFLINVQFTSDSPPTFSWSAVKKNRKKILELLEMLDES